MTPNNKGLFITHTRANNTYGAATSFRLLLDNLDERISPSLIVPRHLNPLKNTKVALDKERSLAPPRCENIEMAFLPLDNRFEGSSASWRKKSVQWVKNTVSLLYRDRLSKYLEQQRFDFVYLNSFVLNSLVNRSFPFFLHVREVYRPRSTAALDHLREAAGIIFIDQRTKAALEQFTPLETVNTIVLPNPFDMRALSNLRYDERGFFRRFNIPFCEGTKVFALIGNITPVKGVDFVIRSFIRASKEDAVLLVIGRGEDTKYVNLCKEMAKGCPNVFFLGHVREMDLVYLHSDFVVRGDPDFRMGRTTLEGIFAGCQVILPGNREDVARTAELKDFGDRIIPYPPGDEKALAQIFAKADQKIGTARQLLSNLDEYSTRFSGFLKESLRTWQEKVHSNKGPTHTSRTLKPQPLITVITVTQNDKTALEQTIQSVINQDYPHIEHIVIDGNSTDGTKELLTKYDRSISRWLSEPDDGIYDAMNKGVRLASGEIINVLNSGDYYYSNRVVSSVVERFENSPDCDMVFSSSRIILQYKRFPLSMLNRVRYHSSPYPNRFVDVSHQGVFYRRRLHEQLGLYDLNYKSASDHDFLIKAFMASSHPCQSFDEITVVRNKDEHSSSSSLKHAREMKAIEDKLLGRSLHNELRYYKAVLKNQKNTGFGFFLWGSFLLFKQFKTRVTEG